MINCHENVIAHGHYGNDDALHLYAPRHGEREGRPHFLDDRDHDRSPHDCCCLIQDGNDPLLDAESTFGLS